MPMDGLSGESGAEVGQNLSRGKVRVAVIGAGGIGTLRHLPAYKLAEERGEAELVAVCDPIESSARAAAERFSVPEVYADYRELLDPSGAGGRMGALVYEIERWDEGGDSLQICLGSAHARYNAFSRVKVPPEYLAGNPHRTMLDFVAAIRTGTKASPDFEDGRRCQEGLEAVERSAADARWQCLPIE